MEFNIAGPTALEKWDAGSLALPQSTKDEAGSGGQCDCRHWTTAKRFLERVAKIRRDVLYAFRGLATLSAHRVGGLLYLISCTSCRALEAGGRIVHQLLRRL